MRYYAQTATLPDGTPDPKPKNWQRLSTLHRKVDAPLCLLAADSLATCSQ